MNATRPYFLPCKEAVGYIKRELSFEWYPGFSLIQHQRSLVAFHDAIKQNEKEPFEILDVSTKSVFPLGVQLSALNLSIPMKSLNGKLVSVENIFQCSKVFGNHEVKVGPFVEFLESDPKQVKKKIQQKLDEFAKEHGIAKVSQMEIVGFSQNGHEYALEPKEGFYFFLYCHALRSFFDHHPKLFEECKRYSAFTDITFNPTKSLNCQAAALAFYLSLKPSDVIRLLKEPPLFLNVLKLSQ
ncbi:MAG: hypothetical protein RSB74_05755 [Kiritimatiellia bacterium]